MNKKRTNPLIHAVNGILETLRSERNFKIHMGFCCVAVALAWLLDIALAEWLWILLCIAFVFASELLNTAIESVTDLASPTHHELAKKAKDAGAGAVLIAAVFSAVVGFIIFGPKLWLHLFG